MKKKTHTIKTKISAIFTLACFFITGICGEFVYAAIDFKGASEIIKSVESFIPFSAGKVSYVKNYNSKDIVINIQDLHCHGESQKNIALILKSFEKYGFDKIYLEGAVDNVSTQKFIDFREKELGRLVIDDLLANGTISGAEYYSIKSDRPNIIKALDRSDLYFENIMLLGSILENQDLIRKKINGLKNDIESIKKNYYNSDQLRLDKYTRKFAQGKLSAKRYYSLLSKLSQKAGININAYSNIERYINLIGEKGIDYPKVTDELKVFVGVLKENIPYSVYYELSKKSNDFSDVNELMPIFIALSDNYAIAERYKLSRLDTFFKYLKTNDSLNLLSLISEEDKLIYDIGISLAQTKYEREIVFLDRFTKVLEGFFTAKITSAEYEYYLKNYDKFEKTAYRYIGAENGNLSYLQNNLLLFETYHKNNIERDSIFISSLECSNETFAVTDTHSNDFSELKKIIEYLNKDANLKIVITGGFHSEGLKRRLSENETSFIIITPNVSGDIEKSETIYSSSISEYYQVFTSAINKMPASADPMQIALPKIIGSTINRAKINQIPLKEAQDLINQVFADDISGKNIFKTMSQYEPVIGAEVIINSVKHDKADFTVVYDYGYGKFFANYTYDFKIKEVSLTVDNKKVSEMYNSYYHDGKEGFSAPFAFIHYGQHLTDAASSFLKELSTAAGESLLLMDSAKLHSTIASHISLFDEKKSPMKRALLEPASDAESLYSKNMIGEAFYETKPFKGRLTGKFKLMQNGVVIYKIDNPQILEGFSIMRNMMQNGKYWNSPEFVHITIGRLVPGKYSQQNLDKISAVIDKYNQNNPFSAIEFKFDSIMFGISSATGNDDVKVETIKLGTGLQNNSIYVQDFVTATVSDAIDTALRSGTRLPDIQKNLKEKFSNKETFKNMLSKTSEVDEVNITLHSVNAKESMFNVKYVDADKSYTESEYIYYAFGEKKVFRTVNDAKIAANIEKFFDLSGGILSERFSDPVIIVNNASIADSFSVIYNELREVLADGKAYLLQPALYHFSVNANRKVFERDSTDITLNYIVDKNILREIRETIPEGVYESLKNITGKLEGYFHLTPDGSIIYKITNQSITESFNKARRMLNKNDFWGEPTAVHFTLGRLFPGTHTQQDIDRINSILDKYNKHNPFSDIEYTFDNVLFGQFMATGNGFVNVMQLNEQAKNDIALELSYFDNASRHSVSEDGNMFEASGVEEMTKAIEHIASLGMNRYEFTFDALLPDNYAGKTEAEIKKFRRKLISPEELYTGLKNVRNYLIANAERIKLKAADNNISISMHSFSVISNVRDKNGKIISINPHPGYNNEMREMFDWQLEIAEALGVENMTAHLEDSDIDGYVEFVKKAANKKIKINFENHLSHSDMQTSDPASFYYNSLVQGFMAKNKFVETMLGIKNKLSKEEQNFLGVTFDTSKALSSYLKTLPAGASNAEKNAALEKISLKNLIDYYEAIESAGLTINNIHLAQFSANISDVRERKSEITGQASLVIYNKSDVTDLVNPALNMADFLRYLQKKNYNGALHQETPGIVSPVSASRDEFGGFIGNFYAPFIYEVKTEQSNSSGATLLMSLLSESDDMVMEVNGRFVDANQYLKSVLNILQKQNKDKEFKRIMRKLVNASSRNSAEKIKFFEIDSVYTKQNGFRENVISDVGGFATNKRGLIPYGIIALRKELFENPLALFHEFVHWALAEGAITVEEIENVIFDPEINERYILRKPFDEAAAREKAEAEAGDNRYITVEVMGVLDVADAIVNSEKERYDNKRGHNVIRAFQAQYLADEDIELTSLIAEASQKYKFDSIPETEKSRQNVKNEAIDKIIGILNALIVKKEKEILESGISRIEEEGNKAAAAVEKPVELYNQTTVYGVAKLKNQTTLILGKDALRNLHYTPGDKVYITSFPGGRIFLFVQIEALHAFIDKTHKKLGIETDTVAQFFQRNHSRGMVYPNIMEAVIDENGVLKISLAKNEINTFAQNIGKETDFLLMGGNSGSVKIIGHRQHINEIVEENDVTKQLFEEGVRSIEEIIRATESSVFFTYDRIDVAFRLLNENQKHITPMLKAQLESMLKEEGGLNADQKAFTVLLLSAISAAEKPDFAYIRRQIKNAGAINIDALIMWLEMLNNPQSEPLFTKVIDYLHGKSTVSKYSRTLANTLGSLTVTEELKQVLVVSENEKWLLETERKESPGKHMLYGKIFVDATIIEEDIDFEKLEMLKDFGIKPLAVTFGRNAARNDRDRLGYVNIVESGGKVVNLEISVHIKNDIPIIRMLPLNFESSMDYRDVYAKAAAEILKVMQNDYTVKGKFAYLTSNISLFERMMNLISDESLFRISGSTYDFDLKAFSFDSKELPGFDRLVAEVFPEAVDIKKNLREEKTEFENFDYQNISSNISKTKYFMTKIIKRLILKDKQSKSSAGIIVAERIDSKVFSMLDIESSPLSSYGINGLSSYFEKRMRLLDYSILLLEDIGMQDFPMLADAALIDWTTVQTVKNMLADGKISEDNLKIYSVNIENARRKSLTLAEKVLKEIDPEAKLELHKFIEEHKFMRKFDEVSQFAQFVLISQIKENLEKIHNNNGKIVISVNISEKMTNNEIIQTALFWQSIGFDGIRLNLSSDKISTDASLFSNFSAQLKSIKSDSILMVGLPLSLSDADIKKNIEKASGLDVITAVDVSRLNDSLAQYRQKIWADINPLNENYKSDTSKYFEDIQKAVAFGAGYLGVAAGANIVSADGKSVHIEIMSKITEILSISRTITPDQAYRQGYVVGLKSKDDLKTTTATKKLIVQELIKLQNGKSLKHDTPIESETLKQFTDFIKAEPGIIKLPFIHDSLVENNENGVYLAAGYLRGLVESSLLAGFRSKNGLDDFAQSELLRILLLLDFSMPQDVIAYSDQEIVSKITDDLSGMRPDEMLQKMLENNYGAKESKAFTDYALYIYILKNNGTTVNEIIKSVNLLMKAHLSEINFGYGIPVDKYSHSANEKWALGQIIEILTLGEQAPNINKSVQDAVNGSLNTLAVSMMLKAA